MASASSASAQPQIEEADQPKSYQPPKIKLVLRGDKEYHVFLSFRGPDVRETLVEHLYQSLSAAGLNVFLDSYKLEKGNFIVELFRAIENSAIHIPIFSEFYARSTWCLKEAAKICETSGLIIPLFYRVKPTHVRYPRNASSPYRQWFDKHYTEQDRQSEKEVDGWKSALERISDRSGWHMDKDQGFEFQLVLVKKVVRDLIQTLDRRPFEVAKHPVGIDSVKNALIQKLDLESVNKLVKVGIWGIGGVGKTTVAKAVYNHLYASFDAASFLFNVRSAAADSTGLMKLQRQILQDLVKYEGKVYSIEHGISLFIDRLGGKRVLLILDDVDAVVQLNALVGGWLFIGSRIIVTSQDKHILNIAGISSECIHEMSGLNTNESFQLFQQYAFGKGIPSLKYHILSKIIVNACKGHPLSLEVLGSFLHDKQNDEGCWTEATRNLSFNPDLLKRLYNSYSVLSDEEKEIFLDIACFFIGEHRRFPILFWKPLYEMVETAVCNLSNRLLIKIDDTGVFQMHDHLRDLGRAIAKKEKEGTRLWEADHLSVISNNTKFSRLLVDGVSPQKLEMLYRPGLRYLHLHNLSIEGVTEDTFARLPPSLIWLRLEKCDFHIETRRNPGEFRSTGNIWQLKIMQLESCSHVEGSFSSLFSLPIIQLQHLDLTGCIDLNSLPDTFCNLSQLKHLGLKGCTSVQNLPDTFGNLSELKHLDLEGCTKLTSLPDTFGQLSQLLKLNLKGCVELFNIPITFGRLSKLGHIDLEGCVRLDHLPDTFGQLSQLQYLDLKGCTSLRRLPHSCSNLLQLRHLDVYMCENLEDLSIAIVRELPKLDFFRWSTGGNVQYI